MPKHGASLVSLQISPAPEVRHEAVRTSATSAEAALGFLGRAAPRFVLFCELARRRLAHELGEPHIDVRARPRRRARLPCWWARPAAASVARACSTRWAGQVALAEIANLGKSARPRTRPRCQKPALPWSLTRSARYEGPRDAVNLAYPRREGASDAWYGPPIGMATTTNQRSTREGVRLAMRSPSRPSPRLATLT